MSAYVIARYDITNPEGYAAYGAAAGPSVFQHGGEVVVADQSALALEGPKPSNVVVLRFPSTEAAVAWYESPEYQAALPHRLDNTADGSMVVVQEFEMKP
ncbi:MAG TPA: DUF1330 domain-containing protein [Acidimicrobiales bacterium]|nr:DUF1330 domain-containing protein [Acidimicrobiales bacterium]